MKPRMFLLPALVAASVCAAGCAHTYVYRIVQPAAAARVVGPQPVALHYDPLDYALARRHDRLDMRIINPTDNRVLLLENRSYVIDPKGESHPVRGRVIGPHSYIRMLLPPVARAYPYYYPYPAWYGWGWGWYDPVWDPFYRDPFYWPPASYYRVITPYNWSWKTGPAQLHLTYEGQGKTFEHYFEIVREREK